MPSTEGLRSRAFGLICARPKSLLIAVLLVVAALGSQATRFEVDASADTLLTRDNAHWIRTQVVDRRFAPQEFLLVAYRPHSGEVFSRSSLDRLRALGAELARLERVESVRSILNVPLPELAGADIGSIDPAQMTLEHGHFNRSELERAFASNPIYRELLISEDRSATALQVLFTADPALETLRAQIVELRQRSLSGELTEDETRELERLEARAEPLEQALVERRNGEVEAIRDIVTGYQADADVYLGGVHALGYQLVSIIVNDLVVFGSAIAAMICVVLLLLFRRLVWVALPLLCCASSVLATLGLFGMLGLKATVISSSFVALQLILTLAIVVHLIVQYREFAAAHPDWSQTRLVQATMVEKAGPCFYAGLTTSVGFGSLLFSGLQPVISFGWMMIIAMFISIALSLLLFPAALALAPRRRESAPGRATGALVKSLCHLSLRRPGWVSASALVVLAASAAGFARLDVENSFIDYFRDSTRVHQELSFIDRNLGGTTPLDIVYTVPQRDREQDLVLTAETVQTLQRIHKLLEQHEGVGKVLSVVNFTELARSLNDGKPLTEYELAAVHRTMDEDLREDLLGSFYSPEHHQLRVSVRIQDTAPGLDRGQLRAAIDADMQRLDIAPENYQLTNLFILYQDMLERLFTSQITTLGIVFGALGLTFLLIFRSLKVAIIALAPNVAAPVLVLGTMGWLGIPLDLMTITTASVALGIAVDDTIHYLHRFLEERADGGVERAVERTHRSVGFAIVYTTLIIVLGFSLLTLSDFVPSVLFGLLTSLAMVAALAADLLLLPVLLKVFLREQPKTAAVQATY